MKTFILFITGITLFIFLLTGCSKYPVLPDLTNTCTNCTTEPLYELLLEKASPYSGFTIYTATLKGDFTYPVAVNWYGSYSGHRILNKADSLTLASGNKSFYQYRASNLNSFSRVDCEIIMTNGAKITKSINN
jgi:hypothetical protein